MATMQKERLRPLTEAERRELVAITKASSERVDRVTRATALLAVAKGQAFGAAAAGSEDGRDGDLVVEHPGADGAAGGAPAGGGDHDSAGVAGRGQFVPA